MKKKLLLAPLMAVLVACVVVLSGCGGPSVEELITEDLTTQFDEVKNLSLIHISELTRP